MRDSYMLYIDKLEGEYKEVFKQIESYVTAERVDEDTQEAYMGELLDVFLLAQEEGKSVMKIIGKDIEQFCKSFCEDFTWKDKILGAIDTWKNFAWIVFIMSALEVLSVLYAMSIPAGREINFWTEPYEFNFVGYFLAFMMASICASVLGRFIRRAMFRTKKVSMRVWQGMNWFGVSIIFLMMLAIFSSGGNDIIQFPGWTLMLGSGVVLVIYYTLNRARVKARGEVKVKFWDKVAEGVAEDVPKVKLERYERKNKKRIKRGKPTLTWAEFIDLEEKEYRISLKLDWFVKVLPILVVGSWIWNDVVNENYFSWMDLVITYGVAAPLYVVFIRGLYKGYNASTEAQKTWIETERKKLQEIED